MSHPNSSLYNDGREPSYKLSRDFGYTLGVTSSHSDIIDYRAMLARERKKRRVEFSPEQFVTLEMGTQEPFRARWERRYGPVAS